MRAGAWLVLALLFIPVASLTKTVVLAIAQDGPLAPLMRLKVRTDENGYLRVSGGTPGAQDGPLTAMANLRGRTDENGYLRVALADIAGSLTLTNDGIGATSTSGFDLRNTTAAAAGAQQYSPRTCWEGQGWKTDATAASQSVVFCMETQPVEGAAAPTGNFILKASINGGAFSTVGTFTSGGALTLAGGLSVAGQVETPGGVNLALNPNTGLVTVGGSVQVSSTGYYSWSARSLLTSGSDGNVRVANAASTNTYDITLADWGTTTSAEAVSVIDTGTLFLGAAPNGTLMILVVEDNDSGQVLVRGGSNSSALINGGAVPTFTITKDTAAKVNVYYDAAGASGAGYYIQNLRGATRTIRTVLIGA